MSKVSVPALKGFKIKRILRFATLTSYAGVHEGDHVPSYHCSHAHARDLLASLGGQTPQGANHHADGADVSETTECICGDDDGTLLVTKT